MLTRLVLRHQAERRQSKTAADYAEAQKLFDLAARLRALEPVQADRCTWRVIDLVLRWPRLVLVYVWCWLSCCLVQRQLNSDASGLLVTPELKTNKTLSLVEF